MDDSIFDLEKRSCGRVARQSSAKARTAVRIRSGPQNKPAYAGLFFTINFTPE